MHAQICVISDICLFCATEGRSDFHSSQGSLFDNRKYLYGKFLNLLGNCVCLLLEDLNLALVF